MRSFHHQDGSTWDVTVGRESWGTFVLLFTPAGGGEARKAVLSAESALDAERELDELSEEGLRERLRGSSPWAEDG